GPHSSKPCKICTFNATPRFAGIQPKSSAHKAFIIRTYESRRRNPFRSNTYTETGGGGIPLRYLITSLLHSLPPGLTWFTVRCSLLMRHSGHFVLHWFPLHAAQRGHGSVVGGHKIPHDNSHGAVVQHLACGVVVRRGNAQLVSGGKLVPAVLQKQFH